jgi:hypothetical protein
MLWREESCTRITQGSVTLILLKLKKIMRFFLEV